MLTKALQSRITIQNQFEITLRSFVTDLSYPGLSYYSKMCEIDAGEGIASLAVIRVLVRRYSKKTRAGYELPPPPNRSWVKKKH